MPSWLLCLKVSSPALFSVGAGAGYGPVEAGACGRSQQYLQIYYLCLQYSEVFAGLPSPQPGPTGVEPHRFLQGPCLSTKQRTGLCDHPDVQTVHTRHCKFVYACNRQLDHHLISSSVFGPATAAASVVSNLRNKDTHAGAWGGVKGATAQQQHPRSDGAVWKECAAPAAYGRAACCSR